MIEAVVFDWGGVLIEDPSESIFRIAAYELDVKLERLYEIYPKYHTNFQRGAIEEEEYWRSICRDLGVDTPSFSLWRKAFKKSYKENEGVFNLAQEIKEKGITIGFLSNTEKPAMEFFYEQSYHIFDVKIFSCDVGFVKPENEIYELLKEKFSCKSQSILYIDDKALFVQGARNANITSIQYTGDVQDLHVKWLQGNLK